MVITEKIKLIVSMIIVGTLGIFLEYVNLPSSVVACARSVIGTIILLPVVLLSKSKLNIELLKKNAVYLMASGAALGFNWIFLFEAYEYTTVAVATLCYYMAPVFVIILSPIVLKEKFSIVNIICTVCAVIGAVLISGVAGEADTDIRGVTFGLVAALLYCFIVLLNKKIKGLSAIETTFTQLAVSAVVMLIFVSVKENVTSLEFTSQNLLILIVLGVVHTGIVYLLFFSAVGKLPSQTSSVLSYVDPITAIVLSSVFLNQKMNNLQIVGTFLILGSVFINEVLKTKKLQNN